MAEKHKTYSYDGTGGQVLYSIYDFIVNQQSGVLRIVTDSGGTKGIKHGGDFWDGSATLGNNSFDSDNDYVVFEPVNEYPGGGRWQCRVIATDVSSTSNAYLKAMVSFGGGWHSSSAEDFGSVLKSSDDSITLDNMNSADTLYISCSNSDTYTPTGGSEQSYTYFRLLNLDANLHASASESSHKRLFQGVYCGGYIPADANDTKPCVMLRGVAYNHNTAEYWGDYDHASSVVPAALDHNLGAGLNSAHIPQQLGYSVSHCATNRSGQWVSGPLYISDYDAQITLGHFGQYTMYSGHVDNTRLAADNAAEYIHGYGIMLRWKPSA